MSIKTYAEFDNRPQDSILLKEQYTNSIIESYSEAMAERTRVAVKSDPRMFSFYQKMLVGRRCSCWEVETSADGFCEVCWGTGNVVGYEKWGYRTEVFDPTTPNIVMVNCLPTFGVTRPVYFTLLDRSKKGYVEAQIPVLQNLGVLDYFNLLGSAPPGSSITPYVRAKDEPAFVEITKNSLEARLTATALVFRVELDRVGPEADLPVFNNLWFRYKTSPNVMLTGDLPKDPASETMNEFGISDVFQSVTIGFDNSAICIKPGDWLYNHEQCKHYKIHEAESFRVTGRLISWQVQARYVNDWEKYKRFPI